MSEKKKKVPQLRFPGFSGEWEERKLLELATFSKGNGYTKGDLAEIGKPIILYGRLYTKYETVISEIDTFVSDDTNAVLSQGNEVIVPASGETAEDIARASVVEKQGIILGGDLNIIRPKSEIQQTFLALSISNGSQQKEMMKRAQGKSVVHLHNSDLKEVLLKYPSIEEQQKIADFFKQLDRLITLHQRKLTHLQTRKKGLLQKMFPKDGELFPELRFPGFTVAWKEQKISDVADVFDGTHQTPNYTSSGIMFLSVENIKTLKSKKYISKDAFESEFKFRPEKGDVLMTRIGDIGTANVLRNEEPVAYYVSLALFKPTKIESDFLAISIATPFVQDGLWKRTLHIAFPKKINKNEIANVEINIPCPEEQAKIGAFFKQLDDSITLHQRKLEHLQNRKKALLQQMFV